MKSDYHILLLDECYLLRLGLTILLTERSLHPYQFHQAATLDEARSIINSGQINAVVMGCENEVSLSSTLIFLRETRLKIPGIKLIVYSGHFSRPIQNLFHTFIIHGFLSRRDNLYEVTERLESIFFAHRKVVSPLFLQLAQNAHPDSLLFTPAERRTLRLLLEGKTPAQISRLTQRSVKTVSSQKRSVMRKLGITKTSQLIMMREGLYRSFC